MRWLAFTMTVVASATALGQNGLTPDDAARLAVERGSAVSEAKARAAEAVARREAAESARFAGIVASASYRRMSDIPDFEVTVPFAPQPLAISEAILDQYATSLGATQPIYTGGKISSAIDAAAYGAEAAKSRTEAEINAAAYEAREAFWNLRLSERTRDLTRASLESVKRRREDVRNFRANGMATKADELAIETLHSEMEVALVKAENAAAAARMALNLAIGEDPTRETAIAAPDIELDSVALDADELTALALRRRAEARAADYATRASREGEDVAFAERLPQVSVFGNAYYSNPNPRVMPPTAEWDFSWDVGAAARWTVWDWGGAAATTEEAVARTKQAEERERRLREMIEIETRTSALNLEAAYERAKAAERGAEHARERMRVVEESSAEGIASVSDIRDAETDLLKAEIEFERAKIDYRLAEVALQKATGEQIYDER
ncbi:MAG: hypothetical protein GF419_00325 [Ignavibacteriales bacterium]|nr:hypothetical protein [Ignavibacteriales bacterium]